MKVSRPASKPDLATALKARDTWWTVLVIDPLAMRVLPRIVGRERITPARLTAAAAVLGVASTILFATGQLVAGAICFELRFFLDCLDGKLARLRRISSPRGAFLDFGCDVALIGSNLAALGWYLVDDRGVTAALPLAVVVLCQALFWLLVYDVAYAQKYVESPHAGAADTAPSAGTRSRLGSWLARRRLVAAPRTVELETVVLFLAPLTGSRPILVGAYYLALAYYALASGRLATLIYRRLPGGQDHPSAAPSP